MKKSILNIVYLCMLTVVSNAQVKVNEYIKPLFNDGNWPTIFNLNVGEKFILERDTVRRFVELVSFEEYFQPHHKYEKILDKVKVLVRIDEESFTLWCRPYELPREIKGIKLYVETTKRWAQEANYASLKNMNHDVRFSAVLAHETWGPPYPVFPIKEYRFHSSSYNNTWGQLVPYNLLYYHRGDDYGAIPDYLDVVAMYDGSMTKIGDGTASNSFDIMCEGNVRSTFSHMNLSTCNKDLTLGKEISAGEFIGKTGSTYGGNERAQKNDSHLHIGFTWEDIRFSTYPTMIEAYFNSYNDDVIAIAGGYHYCKVGDTIEVDGTRSIARTGKSIVSHIWRLHNGTIVEKPTASISYDKAGLYSEELTVVTDNGSIDKNYLQVIVYTKDNQNNNIWGYFHYYPSRTIYPGTEVLFWSRLNTSVSINFGDGSPEKPISYGSSTIHVYQKPGMYTVRLSGIGPNNEPGTIQLRLVVQAPF